jgi:peptide/nickel transport system substrate-binding protein
MISTPPGAASRHRQSRRAYLVVSAMVVLAMLLSACGGDDDADEAGDTDAPDTNDTDGTEEDDEADVGGTFRVAASQEPTTLDFMSSTSTNIHFRTHHVVETLFAFDEEWTPQPLLVEDYEVLDDGLAYEFQMREVTFQNGDELTAEDVVASLERWIEMDAQAGTWFEDLQGIEATDEGRVRIDLEAPIGLMESYLSARTAGIIPASIAEEAGTELLEPEQVIGTGPFQFDSWDTDVQMTLTRYEDYTPREEPGDGYAGEKRALVDELEFHVVLDEGARLSGLETGQYHYAEDLPLDQLEAIESNPDTEPVPRAAGHIAGYINHVSPLMSDPQVRRAVLVALDMDEIGAAQGPEELWEIHPAIVISGTQFANEAGAEDYNRNDKDLARELLEEAGYDGEPITIVTTSTPASYRMAISIQQELDEIGMPSEVEEMEVAVMQERRAQDEGWDLTMGQINSGPDGTYMINIYCGNTTGQYCSDEMNERLDAFKEALTEEEQQEAHDAIQELYYSDVVSIKGPENRRLHATHSSVTEFSPTDLPMPYLWNAAVEQ